jgi:hypothetical protein
LGRELAGRMGVPWFDSDDFYWVATDPPFTTKREIEERKRFLKETLDGNASWILSGSALKWGDYIKEVADLIIYKYVPLEERIGRLVKREKEKFGERIQSGGDMYENHVAFIEWARGYETGGMDTRSVMSENAWLSDATCKIIRLEEARALDVEVALVIEEIGAGH